MTLRLNGSTSGSVSLDAPATGSNVTLELPTDSIKPGLVLVTAQSFTAVSSVSVNNCFTSAYDNYLVSLRCLTNTSQAVYVRVRGSGSDATTGYVMRNIQNDGTVGVGTTGTTYLVGPTMSTASGAGSLLFCGPALASATHCSTQYVASNGAGSVWSTAGGGVHDTAAAYDGFSIIPASGTMTGSLHVYGYRKA